MIKSQNSIIEYFLICFLRSKRKRARITPAQTAEAVDEVYTFHRISYMILNNISIYKTHLREKNVLLLGYLVKWVEKKMYD